MRRTQSQDAGEHAIAKNLDVRNYPLRRGNALYRQRIKHKNVTTTTLVSQPDNTYYLPHYRLSRGVRRRHGVLPAVVASQATPPSLSTTPFRAPGPRGVMREWWGFGGVYPPGRGGCAITKALAHQVSRALPVLVNAVRVV